MIWYGMTLFRLIAGSTFLSGMWEALLHWCTVLMSPVCDVWCVYLCVTWLELTLPDLASFVLEGRGTAFNMCEMFISTSAFFTYRIASYRIVSYRIVVCMRNRSDTHLQTLPRLTFFSSFFFFLFFLSYFLMCWCVCNFSLLSSFSAPNRLSFSFLFWFSIPISELLNVNKIALELIYRLLFWNPSHL